MADMTATEALRDALARIIATRESLAYGDVGEAGQLLADLELDLVAVLDRLGVEGR